MEKINVLSLFDGISCGRVALEKSGIPVGKYYASEIDKYAIAVSKKNYPDIIHIGDVIDVNGKDYENIDLLMGGSPCQSLSITQSKTRQHLDGKSKLFFEFVRILGESKPKYFLFENVASMNNETKNIISDLLHCEPIFINSNSFVPQDRKRLYWTNLPVNVLNLKECDLNLADIMEKDVDEKYFYNVPFDFHGIDKKICATLHINGHDILKRVNSPNFKSPTLTTCRGGNTQKKVFDGDRPRKLTPVEYELLQGLPKNYSDNLSDSQRYNVTGNGWTVDVIAMICEGI